MLAGPTSLSPLFAALGISCCKISIVVSYNITTRERYTASSRVTAKTSVSRGVVYNCTLGRLEFALKSAVNAHFDKTIRLRL